MEFSDCWCGAFVLSQEKASQVMKLDRFTIFCDLGIAEGTFTSFGCDLGYEYVKINADYRT